jgi:Domain of unknown function (DUF4112)
MNATAKSATDRVKSWFDQPDHHAKLARLNRLEWFLERSVTLPVLGKKTGVDALLGLIPGGGDLIAGVLGSYIIGEAIHARAPRALIIRMAWNLGFDTLVGSIPVAGDLFDFFYSSNGKNLKLLKQHLESIAPRNVIIDQRAIDVTLSAKRSGAPRRSQTT